MLSANQLRGVLPAIPTPVNSDDTINADAARALMRYLLKQGVDGVVPLGGTGEYGALSRAERIRMAEITAAEAAGKIPVIAGVLDPGYHDAMQAGKNFAAAGADGLLLLTPYYTNPTQGGIRDYFMRYADESPLPILIYEIPYRTRIAIAPEVLHELSKHERIIGMKACNTDMWHFLRTVAGVDESFAVLSGEDTLFPLHVAAGARGGIVVTATLLPTAWRKIYQLASEEDAGSVDVTSLADSANEHGVRRDQSRPDEVRDGPDRCPCTRDACAAGSGGSGVVGAVARGTGETTQLV